MSLEEGTSFWSSSLMWKVFFCAAITFPTYNAGKNILFSSDNISKLYLFKFNSRVQYYNKIANINLSL